MVPPTTLPFVAAVDALTTRPSKTGAALAFTAECFCRELEDEEEDATKGRLGYFSETE